MSVLSGRAFVVKKHMYGEADLVVTLLTEHHGKVVSFAKGARKSKKRFPGGVLDAPHCVFFESFEMRSKEFDKTSMFSLRGVQLLDEFREVKKNYKAMVSLSKLIQVLSATEEVRNFHFHSFGSALRILPSVRSYNFFFLHFIARYLYQEGVLPSSKKIQSLVLTSLSQHLSLEPEFFLKNGECESILRYYFQEYFKYKSIQGIWEK